MSASYLNFDLLIDRGPAGYRARVIASPVGDAMTDFALPFADAELAGFLERYFDGDFYADAQPGLDARGFGQRLYQVVFAGAVGRCLRRSLDEAGRSGAGLRIRLRFDAGAPELADLPWELLYAADLGRPLAPSSETALVRYLPVEHSSRMQPVQPPLVVLAALANPAGVTPLAVEREWQHLQEAVAGLDESQVRLERAPATWAALQARLRQGPVHVLHFVGHGFFDRSQNRSGLVFEDEAGRASIVPAEAFKTLLHDHDALRLVYLNACEGASSGRSDPFSGVAQQLVQQGVPAVVAMQFPISDAAAITLSREFYRALAGGYPVDAALGEARKAVLGQSGSPEWATPVLFSRAEDNRLFDLQEAAQDPLFGLPSPPAFALPDKPFHYLDWYRREDAEIFFGRGQEIRDLYDKVTAEDGEPIILLYGQSGVGKSSLLAAGLLPRLEGSHLIRYVRRDQGLGLLGTLAAALDGMSEQDLTTAWHEMEAQAGKPLLVVLDQVEEVFTRPNMQQPNELANFLDALAQLFGDGANRPRGRLILGFRKEWLAEVNKRLEERRLTRRRSEVFLERLGRAGIAEVVAGPQSTPRLRARYGLTVAEGLPQLIADDLLADRGSPVAPMLAILLADMWDAAKARSYDRPVFDEELYHEFRTRGLSLNDFLGRQLGALRNEMPEVVDSGLALDLLAYHTTPLGTAEQRTLADLEHTYSHRLDVLPGLVQQCQDLYLLVDPAKNQPGQPPASRLTHDTLAPHVRKRFDESVAPGQRARRVLESRAVLWADGKNGPVLDGSDLSTVEAGHLGMRHWDQQKGELRLIETSRLARRKRRVGRLVIIAVVFGFLVLISTSGLGALSNWRRQREAQIQNPFIQIPESGVRIQRFEVSNRHFRQFLLATSAPESASWPDDEFPAANISAARGQDYCEWLGGTLPSKEQWLAAAKRPQRNLDCPDLSKGLPLDSANIRGINQGRETPEVVSHPYFCDVTEDGVSNLRGNVLEWTRTTRTGGLWDQIDQNAGLAVMGGAFSQPLETMDDSYEVKANLPFPDIGFRCAAND